LSGAGVNCGPFPATAAGPLDFLPSFSTQILGRLFELSLGMAASSAGKMGSVNALGASAAGFDGAFPAGDLSPNGSLVGSSVAAGGAGASNCAVETPDDSRRASALAGR
jgi:hypothetical protein